jgi:hypothetical protein
LGAGAGADDDANDGFDEGTVDNGTDNVTAILQPLSNYVSFQQVVSRASELAGICQHDQPKMRSLLSNINQMISCVRDCTDIYVHFDGNEHNMNDDDNVRSVLERPRTAVAAIAPNATSIQRKQGRREYYSTTKKRYRAGVNMSQVSNSTSSSGRAFQFLFILLYPSSFQPGCWIHINI